jgi:hypothetical protein
MHSTTLKLLIPEDMEFLKCDVFMILPRHTRGYFVISYEPSKAPLFPFELHRRCLRHCLQILTTATGRNLSLKFLVYLDQNFVDSTVQINDTFVDVLDSFSNIHIESVHCFYEPLGLGWYSFQESGRQVVVQLWGTSLEGIMSFQVFPAHLHYDEEGNEDVTLRSHVMACTASIYVVLSLDEIREGDLSKHLEASRVFHSPRDLAEMLSKEMNRK